jgi:hypothetical protein
MPMDRLARGDWIGKAEFNDRLARWFRETGEPVIGDPAAHRRTAWLWIRDGHLLAKLHADTTREAVAEYLELLRANPSPLAWTVVPSATGQMTKIAFGPEHAVIRNFHLYLDDEGPPTW